MSFATLFLTMCYYPFPCVYLRGIKASHRGLSVVDSIITTLLVHLEKTVRILREDDQIDWKTP